MLYQTSQPTSDTVLKKADAAAFFASITSVLERPPATTVVSAVHWRIQVMMHSQKHFAARNVEKGRVHVALADEDTYNGSTACNAVEHNKRQTQRRSRTGALCSECRSRIHKLSALRFWLQSFRGLEHLLACFLETQHEKKRENARRITRSVYVTVSHWQYRICSNSAVVGAVPS